MGNPRLSIIQRSCAVLLLVLFAFSITPRKTLHDLLVSHTDGSTVVCKDKQVQLSKAGFYCDCQSLVAESAFTPTTRFAMAAPMPVYNVSPVVQCTLLHSLTLFHFSLRGPPSLV